MLSFLLFSCQRDYTKELENKMSQYKAEGKNVIDYSLNKHLIVYEDNNAFWIDNLDEPAKKILSPEKKMKLQEYDFGWSEKNGKVILKTRDAYEDTLMIDKQFWGESNISQWADGYVFPYTKTDIFLIEDFALYFSVKENVHHDNNTMSTYTRHYIYYFANPDVIFKLQQAPTRSENVLTSEDLENLLANEDLENVLAGEGVPNSKWKIHSYVPAVCLSIAVCPWGGAIPLSSASEDKGIITISYEVDKLGNIANIDPYLKYENTDYNIKMEFDIKEFSSLQASKNIAIQIYKAFEEAQIKGFMEEIKRKAISINELSDIFQNEIKGENEFINKNLYVKCHIETIKKADDFWDKDGYKFKIISYSTELFDTWWSGYDVIGYTNDESFSKLDLPNDIIMDCVLTLGSSRRFEFKDCKLLLFAK